MSRVAPLVLIVEDERVVAKDLEEMVLELGYQVTAVVASGTEALVAMNREPAQLILMDVRIKGPLDGIDTAHILRRRFDVQVIYLTAHSDDATAERAEETHPLGYLCKPIRLSELRAAIAQAVELIAGSAACTD